MNENIATLLRTHYRTMAGYVSAGMENPKNAEQIFLNANENPYELPGLEGCNRYPEPQPKALLEGIAKLYGIEPSQLIISRGADEAIVILSKLFIEPYKDSILINPPTFGMYKVDADMIPASRVVQVPLIKTEGTFALDTDTILQKLEKNEDSIKLVFLCSPNNPTGTSFNQDDMLKICKAALGKAMVIIDQTYAEFAKAPEMTKYLAAHPNLIILRTLSKSYSFAGMRVGFALSNDPALIAAMSDKGLDAYPIPVACVEGALKICDPKIQKIAKGNIEKLLAERERVASELKSRPCVKNIYPSDANFLLVEIEDAAGFHKYAMQNNVIIRSFADKPGTENCLRLSIGLPHENNRALELLDAYTASPAKIAAQ